jgi:uncharacterized GH25 family protein
MKHRKLIIALALLFSAVALPVMAHDYWIMPNDFFFETPQWISFDFTAGHDLFHPDENPLEENFKLEVFNPDGTKGGPPIIFGGMRRAVGDVKLEEAGTYLLSAFSLQPVCYSQLTDGTYVNLCKNQIKDQSTIKPNGSGMYVKSIKTYVTIGTHTDGNLDKKKYDIELVPLTNPGLAKVGQQLWIQVLKNGKAVPAGTDVFYTTRSSHAHGGSTPPPPKATTTWGQGYATLDFDEAGFWVVYCKLVEAAPNPKKADFINQRGYLLLEVAAQ